MKDKVQKIRAEIERRLEDAEAGVRQNQNRVKFGLDSKQDLVIWQHLESMAAQLLSFIDSLQEEPVKRTPADIDAAMQEVEEKSRVFTEAHKGEDTDTILAQMRGEEPVSEDLEKIVEEIAEPTILNAYGTKELARRLRNTICGISISEDLGEYINELSKQFPEVSFAKLSRIAVRVAKWKNEQMMAKAVDAHVNYAWSGLSFGGFDWSKTGLDIGDKCKLIIIKED